MTHTPKYEPKPEFIERIKALLGSETEEFFRISSIPPVRAIRCNTLKISPDKLKVLLEEKGWSISQPYKEYPEIMIVTSHLESGGLGKSVEHLMGYFYVQEISSMLPILAPNPKPGEILLDLCASPGSKTTQAAAKMQNTGTIIANDNKMDRIVILSSNLERCGVTNIALARNDGVQLCSKLKKINFKFDKILADCPCSGEGTLRSSPKTLLMWNPKMIRVMSSMQKKLASSAVQLLKEGGEMIYSTCTLSPEENEEVVSYLLENFPLEILPITLPLKTRPGILEWEDKKFNQQVKHAVRIYPQDNNTEGFFLAKLEKSGVTLKMFLEIIRKAEKKQIIELLEKRYGIASLSYLLVRQGRDKVRIFSGSLAAEELKQIHKTIRLEGIGIYFATIYDKEIRLSLDAAHLLQNQITKNIITLNDQQANDWLSGKNIENIKDAKDTTATQGFVVLRHNGIFIGIGKLSSENTLFNYLPKERRRKN